MAKKRKPGQITNEDEFIQTLEDFLEIDAEIQERMPKATALKMAATEYAAAHNIDVAQLNGTYFRLMQRSSWGWNPVKLRRLVRGKIAGNEKAGKKVPLWSKITKRVPDASAIEFAVKSGWVEQDEIMEAYEEHPQKPFLQQFSGTAK